VGKKKEQKFWQNFGKTMGKIRKKDLTKSMLSP
jgi:hypothetical protein